MYLQASESSNNVATSKYEALVKEFKDYRDQARNEKNDVDRRLKLVEGQKQAIEEELEEMQTQLSEQERLHIRAGNLRPSKSQ